MPINKVYLADCMDIMRKMPDKSVDLCIVDPPYGGNDAIGLVDCINESKQATKRNIYTQFDNIAPPQKYFDELKRISRNQIIWGVNFYKVSGLDGGRICWDKKGTAFGRAELAYYSGSKSVAVFEYTWNGMIQQDMKNKEIRIHPTQKPVALYKWLLENYAKPGDKIFDSHVGSGSIRIACHDMGFDFEGCEIDKDYWEAQEKRYQQHISQIELFSPKEIQEAVYQGRLF